MSIWPSCYGKGISKSIVNNGAHFFQGTISANQTVTVGRLSSGEPLVGYQTIPSPNDRLVCKHFEMSWLAKQNNHAPNTVPIHLFSLPPQMQIGRHVGRKVVNNWQQSQGSNECIDDGINKYKSHFERRNMLQDRSRHRLGLTDGTAIHARKCYALDDRNFRQNVHFIGR